MKAHFELKKILRSIDNGDSDISESIEGKYLFNSYTLIIAYSQSYSDKCILNITVKMSQNVALFPSDTYTNRSREIALRDFITRRFVDSVKISTISDFFLITPPGQEILERNTVFIDQENVEARFIMSLDSTDELSEKPLEEIFFEGLPQIIENSLIYKNLDQDELYRHIESSEDADFLRNELEHLRLIAFVAEESILPRESDTNSSPIQGNAVPFMSPETLKMDVELPNKGQITGMGLLRGITLITGDDNSGKTTLLKAIEQGIYNHIPGDGREYVVSNPNTVKVKTERGRSIHDVDISAFISNPALEQKADSFSTDQAEGFISQAANVIEAVEIGADVLLLDENTTDDGFLYKSISDEANNSQQGEFRTPYIEKAPGLYREYSVSSILVISKPEDFYAVSNFVIEMSDFRALDITEQIKEAANENDDLEKVSLSFGLIRDRIPIAESLANLNRDYDSENIKNRTQEVQIRSEIFSLDSLDQIVAISQLNAIRDAIEYAKKYMDGKKSFRQVTSLVMLDIGRSGLDIVGNGSFAYYAEFRKIELATVLNRLSRIDYKKRGLNSS